MYRLVGRYSIITGLCCFAGCAYLHAQIASSSQLKVLTSTATLLLDRRTCDVVGIHWKQPAMELIGEGKLGENFRLLLPRPGYEGDYFLSREQQVSRIERLNNGVICHYEALRNAKEKVPVAVDYRIEDISGRLEFSIDVNNATDRPLAEVFYGILGGLEGIGDRHNTKTLIPGCYKNVAPDLFNHFGAGSYGGGNLGITYAANGVMSGFNLAMSWMEMWNPKLGYGLYYGEHDAEPRASTIYYELRPFAKGAVIGDNWPAKADVPASVPIGLTTGWVHFPYTKKGRFHAGPVVVKLHEGDWHEGSRIYRSWYDQTFHLSAANTWLRKEQAWQSIIMSNSEDVVHWHFRDLPRLAADAKKYGVTTFEILGWDIGGIDRGYPQYRPDPRLGTLEEFRNALRQIRAIGVHPLIFANIQWADTATGLFKRELQKYTVDGLWAKDWMLAGWGEGTISARLGLTRSNMTLISPAHTRVKELLLKQFEELIHDGAQGFQLDKAVAIDALDFNPSVPLPPDRSLPQGVLDTYKMLLTEGRKIDPNLAIASENPWDRAFPYISVSYLRMNDIDMPSAALRYTFPEWTSTIFAESPGDRNIMNNGMRYGLVWALAPRHYNVSMDDPLMRPLSRYVKELIRIRTEHQDLLFHGRFLDTRGAEVKLGANARYSVFEPLQGGSDKAIVVVNYGNRQEHAQVKFGTAGRKAEVLVPFEPDRTTVSPVDLTIPPQTCAVVVCRH